MFYRFRRKAFFLKYGYNRNNLIFYDYSYHQLDYFRNKKVYELFTLSIFFKVAGDGLLSAYIQCFGKEIKVTINYDEKNRSNITAYIGLLNSNKDLMKHIEALLGAKIKKMYLNQKEVNLNEIRSLYSLGISTDCDCSVFV